MLTQDPVGLAGGVNLYSDAGNNPVSFDDPYGLCPWCIGAVLGAAVSGTVQVTANLVQGRPVTEHLGRALLVGAVVGATFGAVAPEATMAFAANVSGTAATATAAGSAGVQGLSKLPRPETPNGMSMAEFGQDVIGWGKGSADAIARIGSLSADKPKEAGVTTQMAQKWADFYVNEAARNLGNPSAAGRAELMQHVADIVK